MIVASFYYSITGAFAKILSTQVSSIEIVFFRNFIGFIFLLFIMRKSCEVSKGGHPFLLAFRGIIGILALVAFFYNVAHIGLGESFTYQKTAPIFTAVLSFFFLKEILDKISWIAIFIGFFGIVCIAQPNLGISIYDVLGVFSGFGAALAYTSIRDLRKYYTANAIIMSVMLSGTLIPLFGMIVGEFVQVKELDFLFTPFKNPDAFGWLLALIVGISGLYYQIYMTKSYAAARKAGIVAAVGYCDIIFSTCFGLILGDKLPNLLALCGMILIVLSGILIANRK